ncbi:protein pinocchio [Anthonomus grandis grandis]|uniref:protein pinocchio n=1 Tax=Anthonomus grandis grandis TaxID=2921223 RepID=UPI0021653A90|nr:protein pinocchio [Anthonomus grandis grandis]
MHKINQEFYSSESVVGGGSGEGIKKAIRNFSLNPENPGHFRFLSTMLRVESNTNLDHLEGFTEFEDEIHFDEDDPDFEHHGSLHNIFFGGQTLSLRTGASLVPAKMSLASVHHPADIHSSHSSLATLSHSLEDIASWSYNAHEAVLTIEELRDQLNCCFTCGVSWAESHVSLDCVECGGYALERNCPKCDGACGATWKRDLSTSHSSGKAKWTGECQKGQKRECATTSPVSQELSSRLERLSANS